jgi:hypothetical protein
VIRDHVVRKHLVEGGTIRFGHLIVVGFLLLVGSSRGRDRQRLCRLNCLFVGVAMVGLENLAECLDGIVGLGSLL